jgi:hypothetical protein
MLGGRGSWFGRLATVAAVSSTVRVQRNLTSFARGREAATTGPSRSFFGMAALLAITDLMVPRVIALARPTNGRG